MKIAPVAARTPSIVFSMAAFSALKDSRNCGLILSSSPAPAPASGSPDGIGVCGRAAARRALKPLVSSPLQVGETGAAAAPLENTNCTKGRKAWEAKSWHQTGGAVGDGEHA